MLTKELPSQSPNVPNEMAVSGIGLPKVIDLILAKQTQYYTLWGVYTAVQFAVANFGSSQISAPIVVAALLAVWTFNLGHLGFVLRCSLQLNQFRMVLHYGLDQNQSAYEALLISSLKDSDTTGMFYEFFKSDLRKVADPTANVCVHLLIDLCASIALVMRSVHG